jgi:hypothetical protein
MAEPGSETVEGRLEEGLGGGHVRGLIIMPTVADQGGLAAAPGEVIAAGSGAEEGSGVEGGSKIGSGFGAAG